MTSPFLSWGLGLLESWAPESRTASSLPVITLDNVARPGPHSQFLVGTPGIARAPGEPRGSLAEAGLPQKPPPTMGKPRGTHTPGVSLPSDPCMHRCLSLMPRGLRHGDRQCPLMQQGFQGAGQGVVGPAPTGPDY